MNRRADISSKDAIKSNKEYQYWGYKSQQYDTATAYVVGDETQRETKAWLLDQLQKTDNVLELGCGTGQFSEAVAQNVRHLTATEGAVEMLDLAKRRLAPFAHVIVQIEDCYRTTFADGIFDVVFLGNVLHILGHRMEALTRLGLGRAGAEGGRNSLSSARVFGIQEDAGPVGRSSHAGDIGTYIISGLLQTRLQPFRDYQPSSRPAGQPP